MSDLTRAIAIALRAHQKQVDKAGEPYILHSIRVMNRFSVDEDRIPAILHDVLEDTSVSQKDLLGAGFTKLTIETLNALTRRARDAYFDYIRRITACNTTAIKIKIADIQDNLGRNCPESLADRYLSALAILRHNNEPEK